jgi:hypothetical protein
VGLHDQLLLYLIFKNLFFTEIFMHKNDENWAGGVAEVV